MYSRAVHSSSHLKQASCSGLGSLCPSALIVPRHWNCQYDSCRTEGSDQRVRRPEQVQCWGTSRWRLIRLLCSEYRWFWQPTIFLVRVLRSKSASAFHRSREHMVTQLLRFYLRRGPGGWAIFSLSHTSTSHWSGQRWIYSRSLHVGSVSVVGAGRTSRAPSRHYSCGTDSYAIANWNDLWQGWSRSMTHRLFLTPSPQKGWHGDLWQSARTHRDFCHPLRSLWSRAHHHCWVSSDSMILSRYCFS